MKKLKLTKVIASLLVVASVLALKPIGASASWRQDSKGWWYTIDSSATGWMKIDEVTVETAQEFVNAIGSNKRILLKPGVYNLSNIDQINKADNSVIWNTVYDGNELNIQDVHNLTIEGIESGNVEIKVAPRYPNIMNFTNTSNITIKNIIAGRI